MYKNRNMKVVEDLNIAIILAGGVGARLGAGIPKQFVEVLGKPMIAYTIDTFEDHPQIDAIEIVCHKDYFREMHNIGLKYGYTKIKKIIPGGFDFQSSVINGIKYLKDKCSPEDIVLVHYADCPLVTKEIISDAIRVASEHDCASPAMQSIDLTCVRTDDEHTSRMTNRDDVVYLQAPLAMRYSFAEWVYSEGERTGLLERVEPHTQTLITRLGAKIWFSKNNRLNFKITTAEDMSLFEAWVMREKSIAGGE